MFDTEEALKQWNAIQQMEDEMTTPNSTRITEIGERHRETIDHCNMGAEEGPCDRCIGYYAQANTDIPWLLKRDKEREQLLAALLPAVKDRFNYGFPPGTSFTLEQREAAQTAVRELEEGK